jgi:hypothetical protein
MYTAICSYPEGGGDFCGTICPQEIVERLADLCAAWQALAGNLGEVRVDMFRNSGEWLIHETA